MVVGDRSRDDTRAVLKSLDQKLGKMEDDTRGTLSLLMGRVTAMDQRLKTSDELVKQLQAQLGATREAVKALAKSSPPATSTPSARPGREATKKALDLGAGTTLFDKGDYAGALAVFETLGREFPDDARVWYFTALAQGLATGQWRGETLELVSKGIDREKAGTPTAAEINAAFSRLTSATGKDWLAFYRQHVSK